MADVVTKTGAPGASIFVAWKAFLEKHPTEAGSPVTDAVTFKYNNSLVVRTDPLQLHCDSAECVGTHWFDHTDGEVYLKPDNWVKGILVYRCRHCQSSAKVFATLGRKTIYIASLDVSYTKRN